MRAIKIGILLGSSRSTGNIQGLEKWLMQRLSITNQVITKLDIDGESTSSDYSFDYVNIYPRGSMHPLGPVDGEIIPALISTDGGYENEKVNEWSALVKSCQGFIILTPQYNWGYPGDLKNVLDHLYSEWKGKSVMLITYGGHGGDKCDLQLRQVLNGLRMNVIADKVSITLPSDYIRTSLRLKADDFNSHETDDKFEFLKSVEESLAQAVSTLKASLCV